MAGSSSQTPGKHVPTEFVELRPGGAVQRRSGQAFVPDPLPPSLPRNEFIGRIADDLMSAVATMERLEGALTSLPATQLLLAPLGAREARMSSKIENTFASAAELAQMSDGDPAPREEVREVSNYIRAMRHGIDSSLPLCTRLFCEMHELLLGGLSDADRKRPGKVRDVQVCIGAEHEGFENARFVPPPPGHTLLTCLSDLERFINGQAAGQERTPDRFPPIVEIAFAHYQFEAIHPFNDGNGRLGRLLAILSLAHLNPTRKPRVFISGYFERHRQEYYDRLLAVSTHGDWEGWTRFFCRAVAAQAADGLERVMRLRALRDKYINALSVSKSRMRVLNLLDALFEPRQFTAASVAKLMSVTHKTAQSHIDTLVGIGALREFTGGSYGRKYLASEVLDVVGD